MSDRDQKQEPPRTLNVLRRNAEGVQKKQLGLAGKAASGEDRYSVCTGNAPQREPSL